MAGDDWTPLRSEPEARLAERLVHREQLEPPIPIDDLIEKFAIVEFDRFPGEWDALLIQRRGARPRIVMSSVLLTHANRRRFTLAHELGHLVIPWSLGTVFCHSSITSQVDDALMQSLEAEANRFASELLIPRRWMRERLESTRSPLAVRILRAAAQAQVSPIAALIAGAPLCPPGTILLIADEFGRIRYASSAPETHATPPSAWNERAETDLLNLGATIGTKEYGDSLFVAIELPTNTTPPPVDSEESSTELLRVILAACESSPQRRTSIEHRVSGIIGAANGRIGAGAVVTEIHAVLQQRFVGREDIAHVTSHVRWREFLAQRARELARKRAASRPPR